jgi:hypothetical protein
MDTEQLKEKLNRLERIGTKTTRGKKTIDYSRMSIRRCDDGHFHSSEIFDAPFYEGLCEGLRWLTSSKKREDEIKDAYLTVADIIRETANMPQAIKRRAIGERNAYAMALDWSLEPNAKLLMED